MIIGISGKMGSGKDTVAQMIIKITENNWQIKKFADALKEIASILTGIPRGDFEKEEVKQSTLPKEWDYVTGDGEDNQMTVRQLLQQLGTDAIRDNVHRNAWVNALMSKYNYDDDWLVTDVRFPNEAEAIRNAGGMLIRVNRNTATKSNHPSETVLDDYDDWDYVINNFSSLDDLEQDVKEILIDIQSESEL